MTQKKRWEPVQTGPGPTPGAAGREDAVTAAFVSIANSLAEGYNLVDLYARLTAHCARILDVAVVGLRLADAAGALHTVAASAKSPGDFDLRRMECGQGPCEDCYRSGHPVLVADLSLQAARWPQFVAIAAGGGFVSMHALPMRLGDTTLGALGMFGTATGTLNDEDLALAQAFAHVASVALVAGRVAEDQAVVIGQLQTALNSRVILEQAKGIIAQLGNLDMETSFAVLRRYSRDHNLKLHDLAEAVVTRSRPAPAVIAHARAKGVLTAAP